MPVETVARLFTGSNRLRLAAYMLSSLPVPALGPGQTELESVAIAGAALRDSYASSHRWYEEFAELLADRRGSLDPRPSMTRPCAMCSGRPLKMHGTRHRGDRLRTTLADALG